MKFVYLFKIAFLALASNKFRTFLTVLGIVIGIFSVITLVAVGRGSESLIINQVRSLGSRTIMVGPGREPEGPSQFAEILTKSLKESDVKKLSQLPSISRISPIILGSSQVVYQNEKTRAQFMGVNNDAQYIQNIQLETGRFATEDEINSKARVAILGSKIKENLFGQSEAVGEFIKIKNFNFKVIGVLKPKGVLAFQDLDKQVYIPYTTAQKLLLGIDYFHAIIIQAENEKIVARLVGEIKQTLRENHDISDPSQDDFHVMTQEDTAQRINIIGNVLTIFLAVVAGISLVVGGIGIMNIMLVAVKERTREIGLRKAVGATSKDILNQFLLEAMILTSAGGILGIILGISFSGLIAIILSSYLGYEWSLVIPWRIVALSVLISVAAGLIFGIYPAKKAADLNPIDALRYE